MYKKTQQQRRFTAQAQAANAVNSPHIYSGRLALHEYVKYVYVVRQIHTDTINVFQDV
jgi:hypothetical protein